MPKGDKTETAKPSRAEKSKATAAARAERKVKKADLPEHGVIRVKTDGNPRRPNSAPHAHFERYSDGLDLAEFFEKGGEWLHLQADIARGYIDVEATDAPAETEAA